MSREKGQIDWNRELFFLATWNGLGIVISALKHAWDVLKSAVPRVRTGAVLPKMSLEKIKIAQNIFLTSFSESTQKNGSRTHVPLKSSANSGF